LTTGDTYQCAGTYVAAFRLKDAGFNINWIANPTVPALAGLRMYVARGGASANWDMVTMTNDNFDQITVTPQAETLAGGSMYCYDGQDRIYFTKDATQRLYCLDTVAGTINGAGMFPYLNGFAIIGNRMEVFTTIDGLKFIWLNRHNERECYRALILF